MNHGSSRKSVFTYCAVHRQHGTMVVEKEGCIMKIAMANDHAGTALKNQIKEWLDAQGHEVVVNKTIRKKRIVHS